MAVRYVHDEQIKNSIKAASVGAAYSNFRKNKYLPMRRKVRKLDFENDSEAFEKCADILNAYWDEIKAFEVTVGKTDNSKLHTTFLEEFSCYFLEKIPAFKGFDVFKNGVFAGLKMNNDQTVGLITKDVDFCIGKEIKAKFGKQTFNLKLPVISVEMKTYTDKTMFGEITNTARKLKGANPQSKVILLMWVNSLTTDSVIEAGCESFLDEIVVMSDKKRPSSGPTPIVFTEVGLKDYWNVMDAAFKEAFVSYNMPTMGRLMTYLRFMNSLREEGDD